jgi:hypothetical protein
MYVDDKRHKQASSSHQKKVKRQDWGIQYLQNKKKPEIREAASYKGSQIVHVFLIWLNKQRQRKRKGEY